MTAEKHEACVVCGLDLENDEYRINRYEGGKLLARFCGEYCNGRYDERATSPVLQSASEPQELKEALDEYSAATAEDVRTLPGTDESYQRCVKARSALESLFAKQREEIDEARKILAAGLDRDESKWDESLRVLATLASNGLYWRLQDNAKLREALGDAAREINCAGPVAHRIRVLKEEHAAELERQRETTLTPEVKLLRSLTDYDWDDVLSMIPDAWGSKDILINLRSIASSSPLTRGQSDET